MKQVLLIGKPNSGKSSLFNLMTGLNQKIGNYGGVTVERKSGKFTNYEVIDLPGLKSLRPLTLEEEISRDTLLDYAEKQLPVCFIANGLQLEDNLLFFSEVADLQVPMALIINFRDDLEKHKIEINEAKLSSQLACPVILMNSRTGEGLEDIKSLFETNGFKIPQAFCRSNYDEEINGQFENQYRSKLLSDKTDADLLQKDYSKRSGIVKNYVTQYVKYGTDPSDVLKQSKLWDKVLLHPIWGTLIFLLTILTVFQSVFYLAGFPMDWIDLAFSKLTSLTRENVSNEWLADIISDGIIPGVGGVMIFIPQIAILFLLLGLLEHSGYLSRISFISNRFLTKFGLSGQSIIPLMSSWACAIPAIMGSRVINDPKERFAMIFAAPLMTCSARLPVYTILIAIMFPNEGGGFFNIQGVLLLSLYLLGVIATLLIAKIVQKRNPIKSKGMWSLELPIYRVPNWKNVFNNVYQKTKSFVVEAGKVIFVVSIVLWFLASYSPKSEEFIAQKIDEIKIENPEQTISEDAVKLEYSYAGYLGKFIEPAITPLGYDWKMGIAIISSFAAREVFVGSISTIYSIGSEEEALIKERLSNEVNMKTGEKRFNRATCISLLLFYVFALQCMSTLAIVKKETGQWKYPIIQFVLMGVMAYIAAWIGYRIF